jgi:hypothetical protein
MIDLKYKKYLFFVHAKRQKMFFTESIFSKNDIFKNIFQQKIFYIETNRNYSLNYYPKKKKKKRKITV